MDALDEELKKLLAEETKSNQADTVTFEVRNSGGDILYECQECGLDFLKPGMIVHAYDDHEADSIIIVAKPKSDV